MRRFLSCLPSVLLLAMNAHAGTVDGTINPGYGNNLGRAVVAASPGFGAANPGLRAMATSHAAAMPHAPAIAAPCSRATLPT